MILSSTIGSVWAIAGNDCDIIMDSVSTFQTKQIDWETISFQKAFPPEAISRAIINLSRYCCQKSLLHAESIQCQQTSSYKREWPESQYFLDHLIDVGMRNLDAFNNYGLTPDATAKAWRDSIKQKAEDAKGLLPMTIINDYKKYRTIHDERTFSKTHLNIENFSTTERAKLIQFLEQYDDSEKVSLADKYNNLCLIARNIYESKPWDLVIIWTDTISDKKNYYKTCQRLVARRMNKENSYVKSIIIEKGNKILIDNIRAVLSKQFAQDKLLKLQDTITRMKESFTTIVKQAAASKNCEK